MSTRRLAESLEGLNSSVALADGDLWPQKGEPIYWLVRSLKGLLWLQASGHQTIANEVNISDEIKKANNNLKTRLFIVTMQHLRKKCHE